MTSSQINLLQQTMIVLQRQMNQHVAAVRDIAERIKAGTLDSKTAATLSAEINQQGEAFQDCAERGVAVYGQLKAAGYGTQELDAWCNKVRGLSTGPG